MRLLFDLANHLLDLNIDITDERYYVHSSDLKNYKMRSLFVTYNLTLKQSLINP